MTGRVRGADSGMTVTEQESVTSTNTDTNISKKLDNGATVE